ncbi:uncharacterized protein [Gorilla gorilla gorilla]|uniref:uncharacterized protein isoform X4 n=1 Tax=Gorilla gorilla gorilla TaxID=9595 RepID=UPI003008FB8B
MPECGSTFQRTSPAPFTVWLLGLWIPAVSEQELKGQPHHGGSALEAVTTSPMDATIFQQVNELPAHRRKGKIKRWCPCLQISRSSGWQAYSMALSQEIIQKLPQPFYSPQADQGREDQES